MLNYFLEYRMNSSATLKVQVYVDGVLKKEGTRTRTALSAALCTALKPFSLYLIIVRFYCHIRPITITYHLCYQLKEALNANGVWLVLLLKSLLKLCGCSKPKMYAISLILRLVVDNFSLAFSISLL